MTRTAVLGAFISWLLSRSKGSEATRKARIDKGTLVASGFIASGALVGVFTAFLKFLEDQWQVVLIPGIFVSTLSLDSRDIPRRSGRAPRWRVGW